MQVKAVSKYNRISARKARLVANMVRGEKATSAFQILKYTPKRSARLIEKTLKSAVANAENNHGLDKKDLMISEIMIDEGPTLKRFRPRARGMANTIRKRSSHVTIVVEGREKSVKEEKSKKTIKENYSSPKATNDYPKDEK